VALVVEPATTRSGLIAKLACFQELSAGHETKWMVEDRVEAFVLIDSFATSLQNIGVLA